MIGSNTSAQHPLAYARITAAKKRGAKLITVDPRRTPVATLSDIHLAIRPGSNLALVNALMHVILFEEKGQDDAFINERTEHFDALRASLEGCTPEWAAPLTGLQPEAIRETARLYAKGPNSIILYCMGVTQQVTGTRTCGALANLVMLCGMIGRPSTGLIPLRGQNNVQGSCDMGALPETLPGYVKADSELGHQRFARLWGPFADEQGKKLTEIMDGMRDGSIRAAYIMGENPMQSDPDAAKVEAGLRNLDFLIVQDIFMTPTARLADVILPAASYLEKQGTFTNTERRVQLINEVLPPLPGTRPDWRILCDVINALGGRADYDSPREIFNEIRQVVPSYAGMDYTRLAEEQGLCWPCPTPDHPGTPYLHAASFTRGRGLFTVNDVPDDLGCATDETYPFTLLTGRVSHHYHTGTMTRRSWALDREYPEAFLDMHPDDAAALRLKDNWKVRVTSRQGSIVARLRTATDLQPGTVFLPFHFAESPANALTSHEHLDPTVKIPAEAHARACGGGEVGKGISGEGETFWRKFPSPPSPLLSPFKVFRVYRIPVRGFSFGIKSCCVFN